MGQKFQECARAFTNRPSIRTTTTFWLLTVDQLQSFMKGYQPSDATVIGQRKTSTSYSLFLQRVGKERNTAIKQ